MGFSSNRMQTYFQCCKLAVEFYRQLFMEHMPRLNSVCIVKFCNGYIYCSSIAETLNKEAEKAVDSKVKRAQKFLSLIWMKVKENTQLLREINRRLIKFGT